MVLHIERSQSMLRTLSRTPPSRPLLGGGTCCRDDITCLASESLTVSADELVEVLLHPALR